MAESLPIKHLELRKVIKENHGSPVTCAEFNNTSTCIEKRRHMLATVGSNQLNIYDNANFGNHLDLVCHFVNGKTDYSSGGVLTTLCWLPTSSPAENEALVAVGGNSGEIGVVSVAQSAVVSLLKGHGSPVRWLAPIMSHPGLLVSSAEDQNVRIWDFKNERCIAILETGTCTALTMDFHSCSLLIVRQSGELESWRLKSILSKSQLGKEGDESPIIVERDESDSVVTNLGIGVKGADCAIHWESADNSYAAFHLASGRVKVVDINKQVTVSQWTIPSGGNKGRVNQLKKVMIGSNKMGVSNDGKFLSCGNDQGTLFIHNILTGKRENKLEVQRVKGVITNCLFVPKDLGVLITTDDSLLFRWDYVKPAKEEATSNMEADENTANANDTENNVNVNKRMGGGNKRTSNPSDQAVTKRQRPAKN